MSREQTIEDMKDNLTRMKALEAHAKMFLSGYSQFLTRMCRVNLERAIEDEERITEEAEQ